MITTLKELSDDRLVALYAEGDNTAFDAIIERHKNKLFSYIFHCVKNYDLANDIFQETFVKAIMTIKQGRYTEKGQFAAWLTRIAHNLIIDSFRQEKTENVQSADNDGVDLLNRKELSEATVEDHLITLQIHRDVRKLLLALPDSQRDVLLMRFYRNMSFKEIAERTQVSINTALGRMRYAILNLRRLAEKNHIVLSM